MRLCRLLQLGVETLDGVLPGLHLLLLRLTATGFLCAFAAQGLQLGLQCLAATLGGLDVLQRSLTSAAAWAAACFSFSEVAVAWLSDARTTETE